MKNVLLAHFRAIAVHSGFFPYRNHDIPDFWDRSGLLSSKSGKSGNSGLISRYWGFSASLEAADGHQLQVTHDVQTNFLMGNAKLRWRFLAIHDLAHPMVLGLDFYRRASVVVNWDKCTLTLSSHNTIVPIKVHNFELGSHNYPIRNFSLALWSHSRNKAHN